MASIQYLWQRRAKFSVGSHDFYRAWAKRVLSLPELVRRNRARTALVRQGAIIDESAEIGEVAVEGRKDRLSIGPRSFLGKVHMALHERVDIGARVCINDGVRLLTGSHDVLDPEWKHTKGQIVLEDYVWVGIGAIILPGVRLGRGAVVGAGAVVSKSVAPGAIVVGNPARPVLRVRPEVLTYDPCEFLAANRAWLVG